MKKMYRWYNSLSKRVRDSINFSTTIVGMISTVLTILGVSLGDWKSSSLWMRICIVIAFFLLICFATYKIVGRFFSSSIKLTIRKTPVSVSCGDIFQASGLRVILNRTIQGFIDMATAKVAWHANYSL